MDLVSITENLNQIFDGAASFSLGKGRFKISGGVVTNPKTYESLPAGFRAKTNEANLVLFVTKKPYDNNFFWDSPQGNEVIMSCFGWEDLTTLPVTNGVVYGVGVLIAGRIGLVSDRHDEVTGCVSDFLWDKKGVDVGMRSAFVCAACFKAFQQLKRPPKTQRIYEGLLKLLNDLSAASRANHDVVSFWGFRNSKTAFDVFLCHNSEDKPQIRSVSGNLKSHGIRPWLDEEQIQPGHAWQDVLEASIASIRTVAVFVGNSGFGPWQNVEIRAFLQEFVRRQCPVIPVILNDTAKVPDLPLFMRQFMWVDYRKTYPSPIGQLVWGITGRRIT